MGPGRAHFFEVGGPRCTGRQVCEFNKWNEYLSYPLHRASAGFNWLMGPSMAGANSAQRATPGPQGPPSTTVSLLASRSQDEFWTDLEADRGNGKPAPGRSLDRPGGRLSLYLSADGGASGGPAAHRTPPQGPIVPRWGTCAGKAVGCSGRRRHRLRWEPLGPVTPGTVEPGVV